MTVSNVALRETASFAYPRTVGLKSGSVVECSALVAAEGTLFFLLSNGTGWLFEAKEGKMALEPAAVEEGHFQMRVPAGCGGVVVRETASYAHGVVVDDGQRLMLKPGAIAVCCMRISTNESTFYRLQDERGWVPESDSRLEEGGGGSRGARVRVCE